MSDSTSRPTYKPIDKSQFDGNNFFHSGAIKVGKQHLGLVLNTQTNSFTDQTSNKLRQAAIEIGFHDQGILIKPHQFFQSVYVLCVNLTAKKLEDAQSEAFYALERITQELVKINTPVFNLTVEARSFPPVIANRQSASAFRPIISNTAGNSYVAATVSPVASVVAPVVSEPVAIATLIAAPVVAPVAIATLIAAPVVAVEPISTANKETASASVEADVLPIATAIKTVRSRPVSPLLPTIVEEEEAVATTVLDVSKEVLETGYISVQYINFDLYAPEDKTDDIAKKLFDLWKNNEKARQDAERVYDEKHNVSQRAWVAYQSYLNINNPN